MNVPTDLEGRIDHLPDPPVRRPDLRLLGNQVHNIGTANRPEYASGRMGAPGASTRTRPVSG